jgi:tetratricopeptide (TPR) repeat protein
VVTLQEAILVYEDVLQLRAPEDKNRAEAAEDLGFAIYRLCAFHEGAKKIDRSVELLREALHLRPPGDPLREGPLRRLAGALLFLRGQGGDHDLRILTEIIAHSQEALQLCSSGHPGRVRALGILSSALHSHFRVSSDPVMLNDAIRLQQETLELCDRGGHARIAALINLSSLLMDSFRYYGGFDKAAEAVAVLREALQLSPVGTPGRFMTIDNLACALGENFKQTGHKTSLAEAISLGREALQLLPAAHNQRRRIAGNLAESLLLDFREHGDTRVLDESVTLLRESVPAYAVGHSHRISLMTLLAEALQLSSALYGPMALEEAISVYTEALEACPFDSFRRVLPLEKLADLYCGLDQPSWVAAHVLYCEALELSPIGRPARSQLLCGLSRCYLDPKSPFFDIHEGVKHLLQAYTDNYCHVNRRLKSAIADLERVEVAYKAQQHLPDLFTCTRDSSQILDLYAGIVGLLPRAANFGLAHQTRFQAVAGLDELTRSAVTRAILLGRVAQAVEFLEEGRGVFWSQSLHLRANGFDNVPERDRRELERLLCLLDFSARRDQSSDLNVVQLEKNLETRRRLNNEAEHLISRIRGYPGLSRFLLPPSFRGLMEALPPGYVVIVNTSRLGHHALLLHKGFRLAAGLDLDLPRYKFDSASVRAQLPRDMSADVAVQQHGDTVNRAMRLNTVSTSTLEDILALVWTSIAMPIIRKLGLQVSATSTESAFL